MDSIAVNFPSMVICLLLLVTLTEEVDLMQPAELEDYCQFEIFHPRCLKNEVILMKSATYGRMRVGRCITAEEVEAQRSLAGRDDPRILGCSADVLPLLDRKCSGKTECQVRLSDISAENIKPCVPGLISYLELSYGCLAVVDEERSCSVVVSMQPIHIIGSSESKRICGTQFQPWILEAPIGQKIRLTLLDFTGSRDDGHVMRPGGNRPSCQSYGVIWDKTAKRNVSICKGGAHREEELYLSTGNALEIMLSIPTDPSVNSGDINQFLLKLEAVGCSDLIPPEDAWLKRSDDSIVIGCYSSRQTWHLHCEGEKWIGVFGNCSQDSLDSLAEVKLEKTDSWRDEQVVAMVAVGGFTLTVCLAVLCIGIVCLRKFSSKDVNTLQEYKTINQEAMNSARRERAIQQNYCLAGDSADLHLNDGSEVGIQHVPNYSVYMGQTD